MDNKLGGEAWAMQQNYNIHVGDRVYSCVGYEEAAFDIPVLDKKDETRETVGALIGLALLALGSYIDGSPMSLGDGDRREEAFSVTKIQAIKLNTAEGSSVFIFTPKEKSWVQAAMSTGSDAGGVHLRGELNTYMRACHEVYSNSRRIFESVRDHPDSSCVPYCAHFYLEAARYTRNYEILYELHREKDCPRVLTDESLSSITRQFAQQDEKWWIEEENKAKQNEAGSYETASWQTQ